MRCSLLKTISYITIATLVSSCSISPSKFLDSSHGLNDTQICRNYLSDYDDLMARKSNLDTTSELYLYRLQNEINSRKLSKDRCEELVSEDSLGVALTILAIIAITAALLNEGGGTPSDYNSGDSHAWDAFYDQYGNLTWRCRNAMNGQFANNYNCSSMPKVDSAWPGK